MLIALFLRVYGLNRRATNPPRPIGPVVLIALGLEIEIGRNASENGMNLATAEGEVVAETAVTETVLVKGLAETGITTVNVTRNAGEIRTDIATKRILRVAAVNVTTIAKTETTGTEGARGTMRQRTRLKTARRESAKTTDQSRLFLHPLHLLDYLHHRLPCLTVHDGLPATTIADMATR